MAAILQDEDLIAQAQERERARLEEEAAVLAFQQRQAMLAQAQPPPVTFTNPVGPIEVGVPAGVALPEMPRQMVGDAQYQLEVDRAQRGSGFVNADVGPMGNVIAPGYDPATDPRAIAAEQAATSYKRQQLYGSLLRDGATAAEAFRFANSRYPDIKNAAGLARMEELTSRRNFQPRAVSAGGVTFDELSQGRFSRRPFPTAVPGHVPPAVRAAEDNLKDEIASLRKELTEGRLPPAPAKANAIKSRITALEQQRVQMLSDPSFNPNIDQRGFAQMRPAWEAAGRAPMVTPQAATLASATPVSETITVTTKEQFDRLPSGATYVTKDGRRARKP